MKAFTLTNTESWSVKIDADNVIFLTIDSLRHDFVSCYGKISNTTPVIDELADSGVKFQEAVSTASHTKDSFPGILTSSLPSIQGSHHISDDKTSIAEVFRDNGYNTLGLHSTPMMNATNNYAKGFDTFLDLADDEQPHIDISSVLDYIPNTVLDSVHRVVERLNFAGVEQVDSVVNADDLTEKFLDHFSPSETPQFYFIHYMDVHTPYSPPVSYYEEFISEDISDEKIEEVNELLLANKNTFRGDPDSVSDRDLEIAKALYKGTVRFVDDNIGEIVTDLKNQGEWENTLLVISADHGEEFREHGGFFHGQKLYDELIRVPLILAGGTVPDHHVEKQVSLLDLAPTIIDLCGLSTPDSMLGESLGEAVLSEQPKTEYALSEATVKRLGKDIGRTISCRSADGRKLIFNETDPEWADTEFEFYDLQEDPNEQENIIETVLDDEIQDLQEQIKDVAQGKITQDDMDAMAEERLKSLGYLE